MTKEQIEKVVEMVVDVFLERYNLYQSDRGYINIYKKHTPGAYRPDKPWVPGEEKYEKRTDKKTERVVYKHPWEIDE